MVCVTFQSKHQAPPSNPAHFSTPVKFEKFHCSYVSTVTPSLFPLPFSQIANGDAEELTPSVLEAKQIELEAVKTAESGNLDGSLDMLTRAIEIAPNYASLYNNRAQVCVCVCVCACVRVCVCA